MIKEAKMYFENILNQFDKCDKKLKAKALVFTLFITLVVLLPVVLVAVNYFLQYLFVDYLFIIGVVFCGLLLYLAISFASAFYYYVLNAIINEEKLNFKMLLIANVTDIFTIICVTVMVIITVVIAFWLVF